MFGYVPVWPRFPRALPSSLGKGRSALTSHGDGPHDDHLRLSHRADHARWFLSPSTLTAKVLLRGARVAASRSSLSYR